MGKAIEIGQSLNLFSVLANNTSWDTLDSETIQRIINDPKGSGKQFTAFLCNGGKLIMGEPKVIPIDRSTPFDPVSFIGAGWKIVEEDERSLVLTEVNLSAVRFETKLKSRETSIKGEERLRRLKTDGDTRLDAKVFQTLWENQHLIPEKWKEKTNGNTTFIHFDGTELRDAHGLRYVLSLCWDETTNATWDWYVIWLGSGWGVDYPSAILASQSSAL